MKTPANPENVPLDKIPAGWRLIYEEEFSKEIPTRLWKGHAISVHSFSPAIYMAPNERSDRFTYITPDLPDNGQPWHAHKPGDPAPVEDGVKVDIVCKNGEVIEKPTAPQWVWHEEFGILFYRLHEPVVKQPATFEAHGHWCYVAPEKPSTPTTDRILSILIAAGHITEEQVEQARKLVKN